MHNSFPTYKKILDLFKDNEILGATQIAEKLNLSRTIVHKVLKQLLEEKKVEKIWKASHTRYKSFIYSPNLKQEEENNIIIDYKTKKLIDENFYKFDSSWKLLQDFQWFKTWLSERNFDLEKSISSYKKIIKYLENLEDNCGLLDAKNIFKKKFDKLYMQKVYYAWEYSLMEFWRTKLAEMTFYAKQSQNLKLINQTIEEIIYKIECLVKTENIDCIAIVPWSIDRKNQILWKLKKKLEKLNLPFLRIIKYYENNIPIPQKSIKSKSWRIKNAQNTIFVNDKNISNYKKILLIDDFVWSGATLNITAQKIKDEWWQTIIWFAFVGSMDLKYEVINEI